MIQNNSAARSLSEQLRLFPKPPRLLPRFIRMRDAPAYLGMDKNRFNRDVRPQLAAIPIGTQGIAFDRLDLDSWPTTIRAATGIPRLNLKGKSYGKPKNVGSHQTGRDLAH
jgi:hypothetical protein